MIEEDRAFFSNWKIVLRWIVATSIGLTLGEGILALFVPPDSQLLNTLIPGVLIGIFQWLFCFQNKLTNSGSWTYITALAWLIGLTLGRYAGVLMNLLFLAALGTLSEGDLVGLDSAPLAFPTLVIVHSTVLGALQWLFFMRKRFQGAMWWIPATVLSWSISVLVGWVLIPVVAPVIGWNESGFEDSAIRGAIFGLLTGIAVNRLLERPLPDLENVPATVESSPQSPM